MNMRQVLHIFHKDVRHHWIEILLCQAALIAYCWNVVRGWSERASFAIDALTRGIDLLLPLTWCFFMFRIVQSESLVGDRQFWISRPYEWKKLLAAKILLVLAFINLPMLIAGAVLLEKAGFSPAPHVAGLLWMQLLMLQFPLLPLLALSSVTRNLVQGVLALLGVWLLVIGASVLQGVLNPAYHSVILLPGFPAGGFSQIQDLMLLGFCFLAIMLQYARRKTAVSRIWLASGVVAIFMVGLASAHARGSRHPYPVATKPTAFRAALDETRLSPPKGAPVKDTDVYIGIPVSTWGLPPQSLGWAKGMRLILEAPDGYRWEGRWPGSVELLGPGENHWNHAFTMKYEDYQRLKSVPLKAHISLVVEIFREHDFETVTATDGEFAVPRAGRCRIWPYASQVQTLRCNSPLVKPAMVVVRTDPASSPCLAGENTARLFMEGVSYAWDRERSLGPVEYGVSPVAVSAFFFRGLPPRLCAGTLFTFSFPAFAEDVRSDFEVANFNLDEYRRANTIWEGVRGTNEMIRGLPPLR